MYFLRLQKTDTPPSMMSFPAFPLKALLPYEFSIFRSLPPQFARPTPYSVLNLGKSSFCDSSQFVYRESLSKYHLFYPDQCAGYAGALTSVRGMKNNPNETLTQHFPGCFIR